VLRVSKAGELEGLDLHEHGAVAYPEYALAGPVGQNGSHDAVALPLATDMSLIKE
jgi:ammonium transporter, Amt family